MISTPRWQNIVGAGIYFSTKSLSEQQITGRLSIKKENKLKQHLKESWRDFLHVLLVAVNGNLFTFGVLAFFWVWLNFSLFAAVVTAVTMYFVAVIINQHVENLF